LEQRLHRRRLHGERVFLRPFEVLVCRSRPLAVLWELTGIAIMPGDPHMAGS
jgi:hypothetical protein